MGQAKRRGTPEQRKAAAIAERKGYTVDRATCTITKPPAPAVAVVDAPRFTRPPSLVVAHLAMMAAVAGLKNR